MNQESCPDKSQLSKFASKQISEAEAMLIQKHIEDCDTCEATLSSLSSETLIAPPASEASSPTSESEAFAEIMEDLRMIPQRFTDRQVEESKELAGRLRIGTELRNYILEEQIAESGMGVVYRARHQKLGQQVALKVLRPHAMKDPAAVERFHQEVAASGKLEHPNIVLARDADEVDGIHFLVMELVDGQDLHSLVKERGPFAIPDACEIIRQAAIALQHVEDNGMVHRDIKPSNLMLTSSGQVKLLDLGLAKLREDYDNEDGSITSTGQIMGTADYMSPEQGTDSRTAGIQADIYSLGCTLYYLLTGKPPFRREGHIKTIIAHAQESPPALNTQIGELDDLYLKMLSKEQGQRPQPPQVIADVIGEFTTGHDLLALASGGKTEELIEPNKHAVAIPTTKVHQQDASASNHPPNIIRRLLPFLPFPTMLMLFGAIIYIATNNGTIVVDVADDVKEQVVVNVLRDGEPLIEGWQITSSNKQQSIRTGPVEVTLPDELAKALEISIQGDFTSIKRGKKLLVSVVRKASREKIASPDPDIASHESKQGLNGVKPEPSDETTPESPLKSVADSRWLSIQPPYEFGREFGIVASPSPIKNEQRWQVITQSPRFLLNGAGTLFDVDISDNGQLLGVRDHFGGVKIYEWNGESYQVRHQVSSIGDGTEGVAFSHDGKQIFVGEKLSTAGSDQDLVFHIRLRDTTTFEILKDFKPSQPTAPLSVQPIDTPVWRQDDQAIAFIASGAVWVWKTDSDVPTIVHQFFSIDRNSEYRGRYGICWHPYQNTVLLKDHLGGLTKINPDTQEAEVFETNARFHSSQMTRIEYSPDGLQVLTPDLLDASTFQRVTKLREEPSAATWSPDGKQIAFLFPEDGGFVDIRNRESLKTIRRIPVSNLPIHQDSEHVNAEILWANCEPQRILIISEGQLVQIDPAAGQIIERSGTEGTIANSMRSSNNGKYFAASLHDGTTRVMGVDGKPIFECTTNPPETHVIARPTDDGQRLVCYCNDLEKLDIWNMVSREVESTFHVSEVQDVQWRSNSELIISKRNWSHVEMINLETDESASLADPALAGIGRLRISSVGDRFCGQNENNQLVCYSFADSKANWVVDLPSHSLQELTWLPNGRAIYALCADKLIAYDAATGENLWNVDGTFSSPACRANSNEMITVLSGEHIQHFNSMNGKQFRIKNVRLKVPSPIWGDIQMSQVILSDGTVVLARIHHGFRGFSSEIGDPLWSATPLTGSYVAQPYTATFSAAGNWLNPNEEMRKHLAWMKWDGDVSTVTTSGAIEKELDEIELNRVVELERAAKKEQQESARGAWAKGPAADFRKIPGLVPFPTPLKDGRSWNMVRETPNWFISCIRWSPDGKYLATASSREDTIRLYTRENEKLVLSKVLQNPNPEFHGNYTCCEFSPDGKWLAAGNYYGYSHIAIWNMETLAFEKEISDSNVLVRGGVNDLCWSAGSTTLYFTSFVGIGKTTLSGRCELIAPAKKGMNYQQVQICNKHKRLYALGNDGTIYALDSENGEELTSVEAHEGVCELQISPGEDFLYLEAQTNGGGHKVWSIDGNGAPLKAEGVRSSYSTNVGGWHPRQTLLAVGGSGHLNYQNIGEDKSTAKTIGFPLRFDGPNSSASLAWHPTKPFITNAFAGTLITANTETDKLINHWLGAPATVTSIQDSGSDLFVSCIDGHRFKLAISGQQLGHILPSSQPRNVVTDGIGNDLIVRSQNNERGRWIDLCDADSGRRLYGWNVEPRQVETQGRWLSYAEIKRPKDQPEEHLFHAWDPVAEEELLIPLESVFRRYAWSSTTDHVAIATDDNRLRLFRIGSAQAEATIELPSHDVQFITWNDDDSAILVLMGKEILLVDVASATIRWQISRPDKTLNSVWFTAQGDVARSDRDAIYYHSAKNGGPLSLKTVNLETRCPDRVVPINNNQTLVYHYDVGGPANVVDAVTGKIQWSFINGSDRSGKPVLIRWSPSGQLLNPDEAAEQVYYLVESKSDPDQLEVLTHTEFTKLLPDELREAEEAVFVEVQK